MLVPLALATLEERARWLPGRSWPLEIALYVASGVAAWLVWRRIEVGVERKRAALRAWGWQLLLSGLWPTALDGLDSPPLALALLTAMAGAAGLTLLAFARLHRWAALLLIPYLLGLVLAVAASMQRFWPGLI